MKHAFTRSMYCAKHCAAGAAYVRRYRLTPCLNLLTGRFARLMARDDDAAAPRNPATESPQARLLQEGNQSDA